MQHDCAAATIAQWPVDRAADSAAGSLLRHYPSRAARRAVAQFADCGTPPVEQGWHEFWPGETLSLPGFTFDNQTMLSLLLLQLLAPPSQAAPVPGAPHVVLSASSARAAVQAHDFVVLYVAMPSMNVPDPYSAGHIPGARVLDFHSISTGDGSNGPLTMELVSPDSLRNVLESLGVSDNSHVLLYGPSKWISQVARVYVTLDYLGLGDRTHILDGGWDAWKAAGGAVETSTSAIKRGSMHVTPRADAIVDGTYVRAHLTDPNVAIVDARAPEFYVGSQKGHYAARAGHVTGARNVYFMTLADSASSLYLSPEQARARFAAAGVALDKPVIVYCHIGQTASVDYVQLRRLGIPVRLYDGSFEDWSKHPEYPIVTGAQP